MRLTPPARWQRTPRESLTPAEYATPGRHYAHERSWLASDVVIAAILVGVVLALTLGVF